MKQLKAKENNVINNIGNNENEMKIIMAKNNQQIKNGEESIENIIENNESET
jgi:hypothetical protein